MLPIAINSSNDIDERPCRSGNKVLAVLARLIAASLYLSFSCLKASNSAFS